MSYQETHERDKYLYVDMDELFDLATKLGVQVVTPEGNQICTVAVLKDVNEKLLKTLDVIAVIKKQ